MLCSRVQQLDKYIRFNVCEDLNRKQSFEHRSDLKPLYENTKVNSSVYENLFAEADKDLVHTFLVKHRINTGNAQPVEKPPRRAQVPLCQEFDKNIDNMLEEAVIEPSNRIWASGVALASVLIIENLIR